METQFSMCHLTVPLQENHLFFYHNLHAFLSSARPKIPGQKRHNRASESRAHFVFLRDTLRKKSKEGLGMEISSSAARDALVAQHEICETPRIPWEGVGWVYLTPCALCLCRKDRPHHPLAQVPLNWYFFFTCWPVVIAFPVFLFSDQGNILPALTYKVFKQSSNSASISGKGSTTEK